MGPGGLAVLLAVLSAVPGGLRPAAAAAAAAANEERPASPAVATPCWRVEQFVVAQECTRCSGFEMKTIPACGPTGFIEKINCASSHRDEYKSTGICSGIILGIPRISLQEKDVELILLIIPGVMLCFFPVGSLFPPVLGSTQGAC
ncbi:protein JTB isoform 3-T3 [Sylvia borin]